MRKTLYVLIAVSLVCGSISAYADCVYKGKSYAAGSKVNGLVCQSDGTWR